MDQVQATTVGGPPRTVDNSGWCVLALDGGGVKGLSSLYIVRGIMNRVNKERVKRGDEPVKPCQLFDMICGTSTGGLIAIMLGRLEMTVDECIERYNSMCKRIFENGGRQFAFEPESSWRAWKWGKADVKLKSAFDSRILSDCILEIIMSKNSGMSKQDATKVLLNDHVGRDCRVFVCATKRTPADATVRFRSYQTPNDDEFRTNTTVLEACRATSAAPGFFDPINIEGTDFFDGGLGANNPSIQAWRELRDLSEPRRDTIDDLIGCFISVGCGETGWSRIDKRLYEFLTESLSSIATEVSRTADTFHDDHRQLFIDKRCSRFNVQQGMHGVGLEEWEKLDDIKNAAEVYIMNPETGDKTSAVVQRLSQKEYSVDSRRPFIDPRDIEALKSSLFFKEYRLRQDSVAPVAHDSFTWAFQEIGKTDNAWLTFSEWTGQQSPVLWICGKAGSGKSAMMKKIIDSNQATWARDVRLRPLSFFAWKPAKSHLQKTLEGVLRSLLYQLIQRDPSLIGSLLSINEITQGRAAAWTVPTLKDGLSTISERIAHWRPCFCIDGLDELERGDWTDLVEILKDFQQKCSIVLILSSRSDLQLDKLFNTCKSLDLALHNKQDIESYVRLRLDLGSKYSPVPGTIAKRAEGMFLWAVLVVQSIHDGTLFARDKLEDNKYIQKALAKIPKDIGELIQELLRRIQDFSGQFEHYMKDLKFFLRVMQLSAEEKVPAPSVALFAAADCSAPIYEYQRFVEQCKITSARIAALSCGLLCVHQGEWPRGVPNAWAIPQSESHQEVRTQLTQRCSVPLTGTVKEYMEFLKSEICWLHRCAYDFLLENDLDTVLGLTGNLSDDEITNKVLEAQRRLLISSPCPILEQPQKWYLEDTITTRLQETIRFIPSTWSFKERNSYLNGFRNDMSVFAEDELFLHSETRKLIPITAPSSLPTELHLELPFWGACVFESCCEYITSNIAILNRFEDAGWLPAKMLELCYPSYFTYTGSEEGSLFPERLSNSIVEMARTLLGAVKSKMQPVLDQRPRGSLSYDGFRFRNLSSHHFEQTWYSPVARTVAHEHFESTIRLLCSTWLSLIRMVETDSPIDIRTQWPTRPVVELMIDLVHLLDLFGIHFETGRQHRTPDSSKSGNGNFGLSLEISAAGLPDTGLRHRLLFSTHGLEEPWKILLNLQPTFRLVCHNYGLSQLHASRIVWYPFMSDSQTPAGMKTIVWDLPIDFGAWTVMGTILDGIWPSAAVAIRELGDMMISQLFKDESFRNALIRLIQANEDGQLDGWQQQSLEYCINKLPKSTDVDFIGIGYAKSTVRDATPRLRNWGMPRRRFHGSTEI